MSKHASRAPRQRESLRTGKTTWKYVIVGSRNLSRQRTGSYLDNEYASLDARALEEEEARALGIQGRKLSPVWGKLSSPPAPLKLGLRQYVAVVTVNSGD